METVKKFARDLLVISVGVLAAGTAVDLDPAGGVAAGGTALAAWRFARPYVYAALSSAHGKLLGY